jgi:hypothetical protein
MNSPYTHPSMPGTPPMDFPTHVTRSRVRDTAWPDVPAAAEEVEQP